MKTKTSPWQLEDHFKTEEEMLEFLNFLIEDGDIAGFYAAVGKIMKARNIQAKGLAHKTNMSRTGLYKALSKDGNPGFSTLYKIMAELGLSLKIVPTSRA